MTDVRHTNRDIAELEHIAAKLRLHVAEMVAPMGQGYVQQGLGAADIFTALYFAEARLDPSEPRWPDRDRIFLTTAHNTAIFYATLAERGFFEPDRLATYGQDGSELELNASERLGPFVEASCGSLGQGLSVAVGTAMALKRQGRSARVYAILGDGEMQEGQVWEAAMTAGAWKLDNLCLILDSNQMQSEGHTDKIVTLKPVAGKMESFGFSVREVDGNDLRDLMDAFAAARETKGVPTFLIAETVVGKGVSFLEGMIAHQLRFPPDVAASAIQELKGRLAP